jgi:hypothetical protein
MISRLQWNSWSSCFQRCQLLSQYFPIPFLVDPLLTYNIIAVLQRCFCACCTSRLICIFNPYVPSRDFHSHTVSPFGHLTKLDLVSSALTQTNHYQTFRTLTTITLRCNACIFSANVLLNFAFSIVSNNGQCVWNIGGVFPPPLPSPPSPSVLAPSYGERYSEPKKLSHRRS